MGWKGWVPILTLLPASLPPTSRVFTFFAAEERPLRPAGPPLSARPSRPCSTRLQGAVFWGGPSCTHSAGELWWSGPCYCPHAGIRLPVGKPCPFFPGPSGHDMRRGWEGGPPQHVGLCTLGRWDKEELWLAQQACILGTIWKERSRLV